MFGIPNSGLPRPSQVACDTAVPPTPFWEQNKRGFTSASNPPLLSPNLIEALTELAAVEDLPVATLIAVLINEALDQRLRSRS